MFANWLDAFAFNELRYIGELDNNIMLYYPEADGQVVSPLRFCSTTHTNLYQQAEAVRAKLFKLLLKSPVIFFGGDDG